MIAQRPAGAIVAALALLAAPAEPAAAHGLAHPSGPLGALFDLAQIALAVAFALFMAWTLYDRYAGDSARGRDRGAADPPEGDPPRAVDRGDGA